MAERFGYDPGPLVRRFLEVDAEGKPAAHRLKLCVVVLLWEMAKVDGSVSGETFHQLIREIDHEFQLMDDEAKEMLDVAAALDAHARHVDEFIGEISRSFSSEQRQHIFDLIWKVAEADAVISEREYEMARVLREKLNLRV